MSPYWGPLASPGSPLTHQAAFLTLDPHLGPRRQTPLPTVIGTVNIANAALSAIYRLIIVTALHLWTSCSRGRVQSLVSQSSEAVGQVF